MYENAEHTHYVQGVAWDPLNEYIATQSSDRSMHVYRISTKQGIFEAHAVGKNTRMPYRHSRTPSAHGYSSSRPRLFRSESATSDAESVASEYHGNNSKEREKDEGTSHAASGSGSQGGHHGTSKDSAPLTPVTSVASTPSSMFPPPPIDKPSSRRSSFSGSNAPGSPSTFSRYGRSPSPMPPLPAIRSLPTPSWGNVKLYGDESFTNFFRRLTFSPDGGLLLTPAGQFEDPALNLGTSKRGGGDKAAAADEAPARGRKGRPSITTTDISTPATTASSSVYIYSRANLARPPIAQLPGHKKASVAVRFSPVLYELRQGVEGASTDSPPSQSHYETKTAVLEKGVEGAVDVDVAGPLTTSESKGSSSMNLVPLRTPSSSAPPSQSHGSIAAPAPRRAGYNIEASPALSPTDLRPPTPAASKPSTPVPGNHVPSSSSSTGDTGSGSVFALPYRMLYAIVTMDTVAIYDTQQAGPVCLLTKLHYDEFTDLTWCVFLIFSFCTGTDMCYCENRSPDGQCLILSSRDGYCTLIIFDEILPAHHTQQHTLQLQSIAQHHSLPLTYANHPNPSTPSVTPSSTNASLPFVVTPMIPQKRSEPPLTPAASIDGDQQQPVFSFPLAGGAGRSVDAEEGGEKRVAEADKELEPPKKKRRVALTRVGDLGS